MTNEADTPKILMAMQGGQWLNPLRGYVRRMWERKIQIKKIDIREEQEEEKPQRYVSKCEMACVHVLQGLLALFLYYLYIYSLAFSPPLCWHFWHVIGAERYLCRGEWIPIWDVFFPRYLNITQGTMLFTLFVEKAVSLFTYNAIKLWYFKLI